MRRRFVIPLDDPQARDVATVGGKAAGLGTLVAAGFPVPMGAAVTVAGYELAFGPLQARLARVLQGRDLTDPAAAEAAAERVQELLADVVVPEAVRAELREALGERLTDGTAFAVRSSATAEDQDDASFAGQYDTVLGVRGEQAVVGAVVACWRSFFSSNAIVARAAYGALSRDEAMAVLVQPMIDAECAGVVFSVDPIHRRRDVIVIESAWGLGAGTVDGTVANDIAWVHRPTLSVDRHQVVHKPERMALGPDGAGIVAAAVDEERQRAACLPEPWLLRLALFSIAIEDLMGRPQDTEWAIADGAVWLLQSRALTALPSELVTLPPFPVEWDDPADARLPWYHTEDSQRGVPYPLDHDVFGEFFGAMHDAERFSGSAGYVLARTTIVNGRRYLTPVATKHRPGDLRVRKQAMIDLNRRLLQEHGLTAWDHWGPEVIAVTERLAARDLQALDGAGLADHLEEAFGAFRRAWMVHWLLWPSPFDEFRAAYGALVGAAETPSEDEVAHLLDGEETPLTRLIDGLYALGVTARAVPAVAEVVRAGGADAPARLRDLPEAEAFVRELDAFLSAHGGRTGFGYGSQIALRDPTWSEDPARVLALVAPYLDADVEAPAAARARAIARRDAEVDALCAGRDADAVEAFRRQLALARRASAVLEEHNHYIDQLSTAQLRDAIIAAGRHLAATDALAQADDVYWLRLDEILGALAADAPTPFASVIAERRDEHALWSSLEAPRFLGVPKGELPPRRPWRDEVTPEQVADGSTLVGIAASPGRHRGRARVVTTEDAIPAVEPGDILVAPNAGPLWTPIFPILGGLVLDRGVLTQHSGATAREYGIPAVVATRHATRRIRDGDWVTIDGTEGRVELAAFDVAASVPESEPEALQGGTV
jgi:rifampicin phosphotransferase